MKKLSILAAFALSAALILSGCNPNAEDETADGTGTGTTTETTAGTESTAAADDAAGDASTDTSGTSTDTSASGTTVKTGIILGNTVLSFADLTITENYGNTSLIVKNSDGTITLTAGSWDAFNIALPNTIDISNKKVAITVKVASDYEQGTSLFKLIFAENDDNQSEITANVAADGGNNEGWCDPITTEYKTFTAQDIWAAYQKEAADLTKIAKIIVNPQSGTGDITIQSIEFVD